MEIFIAIGVIVYLLIGVVVDSALRMEGRSPNIIGVVFWPLLIGVMVILAIIRGAITLGEKIRDKLM